MKIKLNKDIPSLRLKAGETTEADKVLAGLLIRKGYAAEVKARAPKKEETE